MNMAEINVNHINPFLMAAGTILRDACQRGFSYNYDRYYR